MARIKLDLPPYMPFITEIPIRITDLNYGGHVGNDTILSIIHEARVQFLAYYGLKELDALGPGLIMKEVAIEFKNEVFYGNKIWVSVGACDFSKVAFDIYYKLEKREGEKTGVVALAKTGMVCYDYHLKKITALPAALLTALSSPQGD